MLTHQVEAYNTATDSENKIHDDATAQRFGFRGGLVPGVEVYAYMSHIPVAKWGLDWLAGGEASARFVKPVYDGHKALIKGTESQDDPGTLELSVESLGQLCASGSARLPDTPALALSADDIGTAALPQTRPPASPDSLMPGQVLGTVPFCWDDAALTYLADIRETSDLYTKEGVCHSGFLLRAANSALSQNVKLGPWIHVGSHIQHHSVARKDEPLEARARVHENYEQKGHLFVVLDVLILGPTERAVASIRHTAIYEPRQVRDHAA